MDPDVESYFEGRKAGVRLHRDSTEDALLQSTKESFRLSRSFS